MAEKAKAPKAVKKTVKKTTKSTSAQTEKKAVAKTESVEKAVEKTTETPKSASQPITHNLQPTTYNPEFDLKEMLETGAHFGHQAKRWHPKMAEYIYAKKDGIHIIDLIKTAEQLKQACLFAYELGKAGKTLIFVGTKRQSKDIVKNAAVEAGAMYIINRWLGGLISNWEQLSKSIRDMVDTRKGLAEGRFNRYTKKERVVLDKEVQRQERFFGGIAELKTYPDALFVIDVGREHVAVEEANAKGIPVIALVDTNCDPTPVDHVIPANDDAIRSIEYFVLAIADAYKAGRQTKK